MRLLYTLLLTLVSPFFLYSLYKSKPNKPKFGKRWKEHFGFTPALKTEKNNTDNSYVVWFHTVSVGETIAATPLIKAYSKQYPTHTIVITTTTSTGAEQAQKIGDITQHRYMPIDFAWTVRRFIKKIQPQKLFIMETELWPNTLHNVAKSGIPITVINARLSQRSANRYAKFPSVFNLLSSNINKVLCQHQEDAQRFIKLGLSKEKVEVTGSIKFDIEVSQQVKDQAKQLRENLGADRPIWIAASTHQGEDEQILTAHQEILKTFPKALLIIVPRHPERFNDVFLLCQQYFQIEKRSTDKNVTSKQQVYLADTMGEMLTLLGAADICFMGGSLIGSKVGGHNLLEPAALGIPSLIGSSYYNFKEITEQLLNVDACFICRDSEAICKSVTYLLNNKYLQKKSGEAALKIIIQNRGALKNTLNLLN